MEYLLLCRIHSFTLKARFRCHIDFEEKISCRTAIESRISFAFQTDALAIFDACRDMYLKCLGNAISRWIRQPHHSVASKGCFFEADAYF